MSKNVETLGGASINGERIMEKVWRTNMKQKGMRIKLQVCYGDSKVNGIFLI